MMYRDPEPVYAALFELFKTLPGFNTKSRVWQFLDEVGREYLPALYQVQPDQQTINVRWTEAGLPIYTFSALLIVYYEAVDKSIPASPALNAFVYEISKCLEPSMVDPRRGLKMMVGTEIAYWVRIEGAIEIIEGLGSDNLRSVIYIPIKIIG